MANPDHLAILEQGVERWNEWRAANPGIQPDLTNGVFYGIDFTTDLQARVNRDFQVDFRSADLRKANFTDAILVGANLSEADLREASLARANVSFANLSKSHLVGAYLYEGNFRHSDFTLADLSRAILVGSHLGRADFSGANLSDADLREAILVGTRLKRANLKGCSIYGISVWRVEVDETTVQSDLVITDFHEARITVDDLEVAQFIHLLLNRQKLKDVLDTITSKAVLLLGRFTPERKPVLDGLADELRKHNLLPIIFDFKGSENRDITETILVLAGLSLFVIVDLTNPKSAPQELTATVPNYGVPFVPILEEGEEPYSMFADLNKYDWVLKPVVKYRTKEVLVANFKEFILDPALGKHVELLRKKGKQMEMMSIEEMIKQRQRGSSPAD